MASTTQLFIDLPFELLAVLYAVFVVVMVVFVDYKKYARMLKWLALSLLAYPIAAFLIKQDWLEVIKKTFLVMPTVSSETIYIFVGIIGTTISPYLFFWDTSEVVEEEITHRRLGLSGGSPKISRRFLRNLRLDNFLGMTLATLTAWFIVVVCATVLNSNGITNIDTAADAAMAIEPLVSTFPHAGLIAKLIFSIGVIGVGLLAVPVLAGSSAYAISEMFGWKEGLHRKFKKAIGFYSVIIIATAVGLLVNFIGINPIQALIFTAVFNGVAAVPLLIMIFKIGNNQEIMGEYKNGRLSKLFLGVTIIIMAIAVFALFYSIVLGNNLT
jgi:Mn2+/Fe2+ NRAMP family transporter